MSSQSLFGKNLANFVLYTQYWYTTTIVMLLDTPVSPCCNYFFFKRIMTLHQGNSCSLFQNGHQVIKKRGDLAQMTSCKLMCYCCYLRDLFGWIIFQGKKRHMVIADWAMVDYFILSCLVRETFLSVKNPLFFGFQPFLDP